MVMYRCDCCGLLTEYEWKMNKMRVDRRSEIEHWHLCDNCMRTMEDYMSEKAKERKRGKEC